MKKERICRISGALLPGDCHGNKKYYPSDEVEKERKARNNRKRYESICDMNNKAITLDKILERHYPHSQGTRAIEREILEGFRWDFYPRITYSKPPIFWILKYGYSYTIDKNKIIIHHDNSQL